MPTEVFGGTVHYYISAQLQGALQVGREEGIIHYSQQPMLSGDGYRTPYIGHIQERIGGSFYKDSFGIGAYRLTNIVQVGCIHIGRFQTEFGKDILHDTKSSPVYI